MGKFTEAIECLEDEECAVSTLSLNNQDLGDAEAQELANALKSNTTVTHLNLDGNKIGLVGLKALANMLESNETLTTLKLANNTPDVVKKEKLKKTAINTAISLMDGQSQVQMTLTLIEERLQRNRMLAERHKSYVDKLPVEHHEEEQKDSRELKQAEEKNTTEILGILGARADVPLNQSDCEKEIALLRGKIQQQDSIENKILLGKHLIWLALLSGHSQKIQYLKEAEGILKEIVHASGQSSNFKLSENCLQAKLLLIRLNLEIAKYSSGEANIDGYLEKANSYIGPLASQISQVEARINVQFFALRAQFLLLKCCYEGQDDDGCIPGVIHDLSEIIKISTKGERLHVRNAIKEIPPLFMANAIKKLSAYLKGRSSEEQTSGLTTAFELGVGDDDIDLNCQCAEAYLRQQNFISASRQIEAIFKKDPTNRKALELRDAVVQHELRSRAVPSPVNIVPEKEEKVTSEHTAFFINTLAKLLQDSLHEDRVFYQGKAGRRMDNGDRIIEVGAGAVDAQGSPLTSVVVNAARVGIGGVRNLYADVQAGKTKAFGNLDIGIVTRKAAEMIAVRYTFQINQLDISDSEGVQEFAEYLHSKAMDAFHVSFAFSAIQSFWKWICGDKERVLSSADKLFLAMISDSGQNLVYLKKTQDTDINNHWDAKELVLDCGVEYQEVQYIKQKGSKHTKYGFCCSVDSLEVESRKLIQFKPAVVHQYGAVCRNKDDSRHQGQSNVHPERETNQETSSRCSIS